jgi:hypothetical protein
MSEHSSPGRPGLPELALGTAVLATDRLRELAAQMQQQLGRVVVRPAAEPPPATPPAAPSSAPLITFDPVHPGPGDLGLPAATGWPGADPWTGMEPHQAEPFDDDARSPVTLAVGLAGQGADFVRNTRDRMIDATRERGDRFNRSVSETVNAPIDRARSAMANAGARGRDTIAASREAAARTLRGAMDDSIGWAEANVVPRVIDDLMPYLISSVVPRIIDGAMPQIREKVLPVVIDDMTRDPRVRELISEQGRGMVGDATEELRSTSATADDAVEASFRKLFHLTPDTDR